MGMLQACFWKRLTKLSSPTVFRYARQRSNPIYFTCSNPAAESTMSPHRFCTGERANALYVAQRPRMLAWGWVCSLSASVCREGRPLPRCAAASTAGVQPAKQLGQGFS